VEKGDRVESLVAEGGLVERLAAMDCSGLVEVVGVDVGARLPGSEGFFEESGFQGIISVEEEEKRCARRLSA